MNSTYKFYDIVKHLKKLEPSLYTDLKKLRSSKRFKKEILSKEHIKYSNINESYVLSIQHNIFLTKTTLLPEQSSNIILKITDSEIIIYNNLGIIGQNMKIYNIKDDTFHYELSGRIYRIFKMFNYKPTTFNLSTPIESMLYSLAKNYQSWEIYNAVKGNEWLLEPTEENLFYISLMLS